MNSKNQNYHSYYTFLLIQQKLQAMNLENLRHLAIQCQLDPFQNLQILIQELSKTLTLQTLGTFNANPSKILPPMSSGSSNVISHNFKETLQKYYVFSNLEKNYHNLLIANSTNSNLSPNQNQSDLSQIKAQLLINAEFNKLESQLTNMSQRKLCICNSINNNQIKDNETKFIQCSINSCNSIFHEKCINSIKTSPNFKCPKCILAQMDPFSKVLSQVSDFLFIPNQNDNMEYDFFFSLDQNHIRAMLENPNVGLEIRSIRLNTKEVHETTWIDYGEVFMNNMKFAQLLPLNLNVSLKKRKDENFFTRENIICGNNFLKVITKKSSSNEQNQFRFCENSKHLMAVFLVEKQNWSQVKQNIQTLDEKSCIEKIIKKFILDGSDNTSTDAILKVDKITISLIDALDLKPIVTPARGQSCEHSQCFSLENYLKAMENTHPRNFKCPICKAPCYNLYIDGYFVNILKDSKKNYKNINEITFFRDGSYQINDMPKERESMIEEIRAEDVFPHNQFHIQISNEPKNQSDVIIIEEDEPIKQMQQKIDLTNLNFQNLQNINATLYNNINEQNLWNLKQTQFQMYLGQISQNPQGINQQNFGNLLMSNDQILRKEMEMKKCFQVGYDGFRK